MSSYTQTFQLESRKRQQQKNSSFANLWRNKISLTHKNVWMNISDGKEDPKFDIIWQFCDRKKFFYHSSINFIEKSKSLWQSHGSKKPRETQYYDNPKARDHPQKTHKILIVYCYSDVSKHQPKSILCL